MEHNHLIIGLGGSGGKIIRHLRKTIERNRDAQGNGPSDARFEYLYVDTSSDEIDKHDEWKVLGKEIDLARSQYMINTASSIRPVLDDPDSFPGLRDWVEPRSIFDFVKPSTVGAAQRRKLGRLVFAQNAPQFVRAVEDRMRVLQQAPGGRAGAVIHVVCGLAGGTGSGSVVDAVAQIRNKYPNQDQYRIIIYAILPEKDSRRVADVAGSSNYYANGYAALAELNAIAVGRYHPVNILDGSPMEHDVYFNGCYLVSNLNEHNIQFEVESELPRMVGEFIYQKTLNKEWEGLGRAEKGENDIKNFESEEDGKARAKLFLSFGVERIVVPEQEIKEYLAYGFAEQATRQLMFNNFRQGEGYADEPIQKDWGSEARKPDTLQSMLLSDQHLTLEVGILEDDARSGGWKPAAEFWKQVVGVISTEVRNDATVAPTSWASALNTRLSKVFDETYRKLGGVRKFYEIKGNARLEMARHIVRQIEKDLFARWKIGTHSLIQLRQFTDALLGVLDERLQVLADELTKAPTVQTAVQQNIDQLVTQFNKVGFLGQHLTDKRSSLFAEVAARHQDLYAMRTVQEGQKFALSLIPFIKDELTTLRGHIDDMHQTLAAATERVNQEQAARLAGTDSAYQQRIFDRQAIANIMKAVVVDEQAQIARTQKVRQSVIDLAGTEVDSFDRLVRGVSLSAIISTISQTSAVIVEMAHAEIAKNLQPVLQVNIVERLQKQYDANPNGLKAFVSELYEKSGTMIRYNKTEVDRSVANNAGGTRGTRNTVAVFLPECESQKDFHASLTRLFEQQKDPASDTVVAPGKLSNEVVILKVASLMPARFIEPLEMMKRHYDGLLKDVNESFLLHGDGDGKNLPPLYARSSAEVSAQAKRKPYLLLARLLEMLKERQNKTTGEQEWAFIYKANGLPASKVLRGATWQAIIGEDHPADLQGLIEREVSRRVDVDLKHKDEKEKVFQRYIEFATARFEEAGEDDQDPEFLALSGMQKHVREIIGLPANIE